MQFLFKLSNFICKTDIPVKFVNEEMFLMQCAFKNDYNNFTHAVIRIVSQFMQ